MRLACHLPLLERRRSFAVVQGDEVKRTGYLAFLFSLAAVAFASDKVSPDLRSQDKNSTVDVIVQYKHSPTSGHHDKIAEKGGILQQEFKAVKGAVYSLPLQSLKHLEADSEVVYVSPNRKVRGAADSITYDYTPQSVGSAGLSSSGGNGVGVAVIDSGINANNDLNSAFLRSRVVYKQSFVSGGANDDYGHGTHIAGIIAGNGANSTGLLYYRQIKGIAPSADLVNLRVLDQ
ncbi:MAG: S8 family serine peptidase, partial [Acidobacteriota bacterium]|nr:S8 family serine peptidase [Acidobacteriota bacterium]